MSRNYNNNQQVSKPLMMALIVVVIAGAAYFGYSALSGGKDAVPNVPQKPADLKPMTPEELAKQPGAINLR